MDKKTKKISLICLLCLLTISTVSIIAYFTDFANKDNDFKVGYNELIINENSINKDEITSNKTINKTISVTNTGDTDSFIRVFISFSDSIIKDSYANLNINNTDWVYFSSSDPDSSNETYGYYYYKKVLKPSETTTNLLNSITFKDISTMPKFQLITYGESIQANQKAFSKDVLDENGYPELAKTFDVLLNK